MHACTSRSAVVAIVVSLAAGVVLPAQAKTSVLHASTGKPAVHCDVEKEFSRTVKRGDTLYGIAKEIFGDVACWRAVSTNRYDWKSLSNGAPRIEPGEKIVIKPLSGSGNGFRWTDISHAFGEGRVVDAAYDPANRQWLVVGNRLPRLGWGRWDIDFYASRLPGEGFGFVALYDGERVLDLTRKYQAVTSGRASAVSFDGSTFWISTNDRNGRHLETQLITFDGRNFSVDTSVKPTLRTGFLDLVAGKPDDLLFAAGWYPGIRDKEGRAPLYHLKDGVLTDLSAGILDWHHGNVIDLKYNGSYWMLVVDGQLYRFDGVTLEYVSDRPEMKSLLGKYNEGAYRIDWLPNEKMWVAGNSGGSGHRQHPTLFMFDPVSRQVKDLLPKKPSKILDFVVSPFGILTMEEGKMRVHGLDGSVQEVGPLRYTDISCSADSCLVVMMNGARGAEYDSHLFLLTRE